MSQQPRPDSAENCPQLLGQPGRSLVWTREKVTRTVKCWEKRHEIQVQHRNYRNSVQKEKSKETSLPVQWAWLKLGNQNKLLNEKGRNTNLSGIHFNSHHLLLRHRFCYGEDLLDFPLSQTLSYQTWKRSSPGDLSTSGLAYKLDWELKPRFPFLPMGEQI